MSESIHRPTKLYRFCHHTTSLSCGKFIFFVSNRMVSRIQEPRESRTYTRHHHNWTIRRHRIIRKHESYTIHTSTSYTIAHFAQRTWIDREMESTSYGHRAQVYPFIAAAGITTDTRLAQHRHPHTAVVTQHDGEYIGSIYTYSHLLETTIPRTHSNQQPR